MGKVRDVPMVDPPKDLSGPIGLKAVLLQPRREGLFAQIFDVFAVWHGSKGFLFRFVLTQTVGLRLKQVKLPDYRSGVLPPGSASPYSRE